MSGILGSPSLLKNVVVLTLLVSGLVGGLAWSGLARPRADAREIVLVARGMAFYTAEGSSPNPTLVVTPGEEIRLTLRHDDPGFTHDFAATSLGVFTKPLDDVGSSTSVVFRAPQQTGRHTYFCNPHSKMMKGVIEIR